MSDDLVPVDGYVLCARLQFKPGTGERFAARVRAALPEIRREPGTRQFACYAAYDDPDAFLMYEEFDDEAAFQAHRSAPTTAALREGLPDRLARPAERSLWTQVRRPSSPAELRSTKAGHTTAVLFRLKPGTVAETAAEIADNVDAMTGIVRFDLNRSLDDPHAFLICARWVDRAAWEDHQTNPAYEAFTRRVAPNYDGSANRSLWRVLPE